MSTSRPKKRPATVALVGGGPGDDRLLTLRGAELLESAAVVIVDAERFAALLARHAPDVELIDPSSASEADLSKLSVRYAREGRSVVRIYAGDPWLGGAGADFAAAVMRSAVPVEVVPGVSAAAAVPTYAGVPLTDRRRHAFTVVDLAAGAPDWDAIVDVPTLVLVDAEESLARLADELVAHGRAATTPVAVTSRGTTTAQRTVVTTVERMGADAGRMPGPVTIVVGDVVAQREKVSWFESRPLFGWRVLVPRTREQAKELGEQLRAYGAIPVEVPTIAVEPPRTPAAMDRAIGGLVSGRYSWVAFTSVNAVRAVREKIEERGLDARALGGVKVACVGDATAAAVEAWGIRPDLVPTEQASSEALLSEWPVYDGVYDGLDRVLLPRADIATETLSAGLKELGWEVDDVTAYRTVRAAPPPADTREAIKTGGFDAVLFTSSSTVRNLVGIAGKPHASTVIAVIGPQTAKTAEELGLRVDVLAGKPSSAALAEALADYGVQWRATQTEPPGKANRSKAVKKAR